MQIEEVLPDDEVETVAEKLATNIFLTFVYHDRREYEKAVNAQSIVDNYQFKHLSRSKSVQAATKYVDSLWGKDELERNYVDELGDVDFDSEIKNADWGMVEKPLKERASIVGMDSAYAKYTTKAWKNHKIERDYWTPFLKAQKHEVQAILQSSQYPEKPRSGQSGFGPEPAMYLVGVESHDIENGFKPAVETMQTYFARLLEKQLENGMPLHPSNPIECN